MSRLGEPSLPERELQILALIHADTHCNSDPKHITTTPIP